MELMIHSLQESQDLGICLGKCITFGALITLEGDLGAGKTTFTKGIAKGLGIEAIVNSPTFTILKQYEGRMPLSHFDAYRLEDSDLDLGFEEIFESDDVCVVEWARFIEEILPKERLAITIKKIDDNQRCFIFEAVGQQYKDIIKELTK